MTPARRIGGDTSGPTVRSPGSAFSGKGGRSNHGNDSLTGVQKTIASDTAEGDAFTDLILTIFVLNGRFMRIGDELLGDMKLSGARWQVFCAITDEPRTAAQIARRFEGTRQGVLWVVQGLIEDGIVELIDNPDHKRARLVKLTDHGRALLATVHERQRRWANALGSRFSVPELRATIDRLEAVAAALGAPDTANDRDE